MNILEKVLSEMPNEFSSHKFNAKAKDYGFPQSRIINGHTKVFLTAHAVLMSGSDRMWTKRGVFAPSDKLTIGACIEFLNKNGIQILNEENAIAMMVSKGFDIISEESAVKLLKQKGYKLLKP